MRDNFMKIIAILKYLRLSLKRPNLDFNSRFKIQKIVFLSKVLGIDLYPIFSIYVHGPYSHALAIDYYKNPELVEHLTTDFELTDTEKSILNNLKEKVLDHYLAEEYEAELLEAISTIIYFKTDNPSLSNDDIFLKVKQLKPFLKEWMIVIANNISKQLLFKSEYLTDEIKKEIQLWDKIE